jgi:hypothetical protein
MGRLDNLPENIFDIIDKDQFMDVINLVMSCDEKLYTLIDNLIYFNSADGMASSFMKLETIQKMYEEYKYCIKHGKSYTDFYKINDVEDRVKMAEYLMFGGKFKLITVPGSHCVEIHEQDELIFYQQNTLTSFIGQIGDKYYYMPYDNFAPIKTYTPVKSTFKFVKATNCEFLNDIIHVWSPPSSFPNFMRINDQYDPEKFLLCANTFDLINAETGKHIKPQHLTQITAGCIDYINEHIKKYAPGLQSLPPPGGHMEILCGDEWGDYDVYTFSRVTEIGKLLPRIADITQPSAVPLL